MVAALLAVVGVVTLAPGGVAQDDRPRVDVIQISGMFDRIQADFLLRSIRDAEKSGSVALVVQLDSPRAVLDSAELDKVMGEVRGAQVPVAAWVGPARNGHVGGKAVLVWRAAQVRGVAPGASVEGQAHPRVRPDKITKWLTSPTLGDFIVDLDGQAGIRIPTRVVNEGDTPHRVPEVTVHFSKPPLVARTIHGITSPGPAYALLVAGLLLAVLEFTTAGVGLAALTGILLVGLASLGLGGLPVNGWGVAAIVFGLFGLSIDLQAGAPRAWTAIGSTALVGGTLILYRDGMDVPLVWAVVVVGLTLVFMLAGLPALVRARFSTPTIGRDHFIGEQGTAVGAVDPEGVVEVLGAPWRARTNRATPLAAGDAVRVVAIDGLLLEVEPITGAARDYRERGGPPEHR